MKFLTTYDMLTSKPLYVALCQASYLADPRYFTDEETAKAYVKEWNETHNIDWEAMCLYELKHKQIYDI